MNTSPRQVLKSLLFFRQRFSLQALCHTNFLCGLKKNKYLCDDKEWRGVRCSFSVFVGKITAKVISNDRTLQ